MKEIHAILRHDPYVLAAGLLNSHQSFEDLEQSIMLVKIVELTREEVEAEVNRLNSLNESSKYWFQQISLSRIKLDEQRILHQ